MSALLRDRLLEGLQRPLPGQVAQYKMAHVLRQQIPAPSPTARRAAVLALLYPYTGEGIWDANLIFIQRASRDTRDRHAGQISFPGGSQELDDENFAATATRETWEEIGVPIEKIEVLGALTELYIPVSNFLVAPFVGYIDHRPDFIRQESEVDAVLEIPFDSFFNPAARQLMNKELTNGMRLTNVPYWNVSGHQVWGATAMITSELIELVKK
jgi:8-oxo-dGTP pyrophosphatase MutT (NUDIX family)